MPLFVSTLSILATIQRDPDGSGLIYSSADVVTYEYNGTSRMVKVDYRVPNIRREMFGITATDYDAGDRFGRTIRQQWVDYTSGTTTRDQFDYTYDYAGNRLTRDIPSSLYATDKKDQAYTYDGLQRLKDYKSGTLSEGSISGLANKSQETWSLDQIGNWTYYQQFVDTKGKGRHSSSQA